MMSFLSRSQPEFLNTAQTRAALERLVASAQERLVLVTAFVDFEKLANFWRDVELAADRGVEVSLYAREDESFFRNASGAGEILSDPRVHAFCVPNLHAKIYFNEQAAVFGSINLVAASFAQSIDFTVRVKREHPLFGSAENFVKTEVEPFARPVLLSGGGRPRKSSKSGTKRKEAQAQSGDHDACFRCGRSGHWEEECYASTHVDGGRL
jgi:hypothetical protein